MVHRDKNFLPAGYKRDTTPVNPIIFSMDQMIRTKEDDFKYNNENINFECVSFFLLI